VSDHALNLKKMSTKRRKKPEIKLKKREIIKNKNASDEGTFFLMKSTFNGIATCL
jgi:hypothetical protein